MVNKQTNTLRKTNSHGGKIWLGPGFRGFSPWSPDSAVVESVVRQVVKREVYGKYMVEQSCFPSLRVTGKQREEARV